MKTTYSEPKVALPPPEEQPTMRLEEGVRTAKVRLLLDYWPTGGVEPNINQPYYDPSMRRLLAGMIVDLPYEEARRAVQKRIATLIME